MFPPPPELYSAALNPILNVETLPCLKSPRPDEVNGVSYNFVTKEIFHEMVQDGKFLEWATVHDNFYGTSIDAFKAGTLSSVILKFLVTAEFCCAW